MLASQFPDRGLVSPKQLPALHAQLHCCVDDVPLEELLASVREHGIAE